MAKNLHIHVYGHVQGVYYRESAQRKAKALELVGSVKNNLDGSVSIEVQGEGWRVDQFVVWANEGPPGAEVERLHTEFGNIKDLTDFKLEY